MDCGLRIFTILKARHAAQVTGLPAIADDSGLAVDFLGGAPGIYSARYSGVDATDQQNLEKLLVALKDVPDGRGVFSVTHIDQHAVELRGTLFVRHILQGDKQLFQILLVGGVHA